MQFPQSLSHVFVHRIRRAKIPQREMAVLSSQWSEKSFYIIELVVPIDRSPITFRVTVPICSPGAPCIAAPSDGVSMDTAAPPSALILSGPYDHTGAIHARQTSYHVQRSCQRSRRESKQPHTDVDRGPRPSRDWRRHRNGVCLTDQSVKVPRPSLKVPLHSPDYQVARSLID